MGDRGPNSQNKNMHVLPAPKNKRKSPMPGMTKPARVIWTRTVNAYPADHFKPQHYDLLRMYCGACVLQKRAEHEYETTGDIIEQKNGVIKENPYINIAIKAESSATRLATKLGITVNNTMVARGQSGQNSKPKSKRGDLMFRGD